jgi:hypothetical protein
MLQANARAAGAAPPDSRPSSPRRLLMRRLARQPAPMRAGQRAAQPSRRRLDRHHPQCSASADQEQGNRVCPGCRLRDPAKPGVKHATVTATAQYQQIKRVLGGVGAQGAGYPAALRGLQVDPCPRGRSDGGTCPSEALLHLVHSRRLLSCMDPHHFQMRRPGEDGEGHHMPWAIADHGRCRSQRYAESGEPSHPTSTRRNGPPAHLPGHSCHSRQESSRPSSSSQPGPGQEHAPARYPAAVIAQAGPGTLLVTCCERRHTQASASCPTSARQRARRHATLDPGQKPSGSTAPANTAGSVSAAPPQRVPVAWTHRHPAAKPVPGPVTHGNGPRGALGTAG